jgi:hypothetical protein
LRFREHKKEARRNLMSRRAFDLVGLIGFEPTAF